MTFEELRITYQCPERMARDLFAQLAQVESALALAELQRDKMKNKLAPAVPRRTNRGEN